MQRLTSEAETILALAELLDPLDEESKKNVVGLVYQRLYPLPTDFASQASNLHELAPMMPMLELAPTINMSPEHVSKAVDEIKSSLVGNPGHSLKERLTIKIIALGQNERMAKAVIKKAISQLGKSAGFDALFSMASALVDDKSYAKYKRKGGSAARGSRLSETSQKVKDTVDYIERKGEVRPGDIAAWAGITKAGANFRLKKILDLGLIEKPRLGIYRVAS